MPQEAVKAGAECRRRDNKDCGPLPHAAVDLGLDMIECQMMAKCQEGQPNLPQNLCLATSICLALHHSIALADNSSSTVPSTLCPEGSLNGSCQAS